MYSVGIFPTCLPSGTDRDVTYECSTSDGAPIYLSHDKPVENDIIDEIAVKFPLSIPDVTQPQSNWAKPFWLVDTSPHTDNIAEL